MKKALLFSLRHSEGAVGFRFTTRGKKAQVTKTGDFLTGSCDFWFSNHVCRLEERMTLVFSVCNSDLWTCLLPMATVLEHVTVCCCYGTMRTSWRTSTVSSSLPSRYVCTSWTVHISSNVSLVPRLFPEFISPEDKIRAWSGNGATLISLSSFHLLNNWINDRGSHLTRWCTSERRW